MSNIIHKWILRILSSLGLKRKLSALFQTLSGIITTIPSLAVFAPALQAIASWLGIAGIGHATLAGTVKVNLSTVAAFFSALVIAAQHVPQLTAFVPVIQAVALVLGFFTSVDLLGNREK